MWGLIYHSTTLHERPVDEDVKNFRETVLIARTMSYGIRNGTSEFSSNEEDAIREFHEV